MVQSAPGHTGNYCVRFNYLSASPVYDGGHIEFNSGPTNVAPIMVTGWWKDEMFDFLETTILKVFVYDNAGNYMGEGLVSTGGISAHPNWTQFTCLVTYINSNPVGYYKISIDSWPDNSYRSYVDDLDMTFNVSSIANSDDIINASYISNYKGNSYLHFNSKKETTGQIRVCDLNGREISNEKKKFSAGEGIYCLNTKPLSAGIYICSIHINDVSFNKRFIISN